MSKYFIGVIILMGVALSVCISGWNNTKKEKDRLSSNQEALLSDVEFYKTESGKNAASVQALELKTSELEKHKKDLTQTVKDLNIKLSRVKSTSTTVTESNYQIEATIRDSIVYRDRLVPVYLKCVDYQDPYINFVGCIDSAGKFTGNIATIDTLDQVVHRVPKKIWFIKWGTKAIRQEIVSRNPNSKIVYSEYIEVK